MGHGFHGYVSHNQRVNISKMGFVNGNNRDHGDIWYMIDDKFRFEII